MLLDDATTEPRRDPRNQGAAAPRPFQATVDEASAIDAAGALARCMGDPRIFALTLDAFLRDVPPRAGTLPALLAENRLADVGRVAHAIRGAAGLLNAHPLAQCAADMEAASTTRDLEQIERSIGRLQAEVARCIELVEALRNGSPGPNQPGTGGA
jgi:HPt (histidine-containing phosphotransfer) domain-containing protein